MRVLHIVHDTGIGGVQRIAADLRNCGHLQGEECSERTDSPRVAADPGPTAPRGLTYRVAALRRPSPRTDLFTPDIPGRGLNSPLGWIALARMIRHRATEPDLVICSLWRSVLVMQLARLLGSRVRWAIWVHSSRFTSAPDRWIHRWALPRADHVLCDSTTARDDLVLPIVRAAGASIPVHIVRPAVRPFMASGHRPLSEDRPIRLVTWGRIERAKNLPAAVDIAAALADLRPAGAWLTVIGPDSGDAERVRQHAVDSGFGPHLELAGIGDRDRIARAVRNADVFIQTSQFEGFSIAAHEALASGMLCVLTPVGDLATDTVDGVHAVHHHGDVRATAARLAELCRDAARVRRMRESAASLPQHNLCDTFHRVCSTAVADGAEMT